MWRIPRRVDTEVTGRRDWWGAALLALALSEEARGIRGLDVLRRSVDRAPPTQS